MMLMRVYTSDIDLNCNQTIVYIILNIHICGTERRKSQFSDSQCQIKISLTRQSNDIRSIARNIMRISFI